ncbi:MAG: clan AA aspartic protease [Candidatus Methanodesulfokora sp.]
MTPVVGIAVRNPFADRRYLEEGKILAVIDTGYEGFLLIPMDVFDHLFGKLKAEERVLVLADGREMVSKGTYGEVLSECGISEGFIETVKGVEEFVLGSEFLGDFILELDYCAKSLSMRKCRRS